MITYNFDILKSRTVAGLCFIAVLLIPIFLLALLRTPDLRAYIPDFLYQDITLPLTLQVLAPIYLIYNKRRLLWKNVDVVLDKVNAELSIEGNKYSFDDLEYYELIQGSMLTSGIGRDFIILKFRNSKKTELVPCRSSESVINYDAFVTHFFAFIDKYFEEDKEKPENKLIKRIAVALLIIGNVSFFVFLFLDARAAAKLVPAMFTVYGVCLPLIFKKKRTGRSIPSENKV